MQCSAFFCKRTKHSRVLLRSLQKNETFSAFFTFFAKEHCVILGSEEKNAKERCTLLGLISRQKL